MIGRTLWVACAIACLAPAFSLAQKGIAQTARTLDKRDKTLLERSVGMNQSPTRLIVRFKSDASDNDRANARSSVKGTLLHRSRLVQGLEVLDSDLGAPNAINALRHNPNVLYAEFDSVVRVDSVPNDHQYSLLWALNDNDGYNIHAPEAWGLYTGDPNFVIADIDTGMQLDNIDLAANLYTNPKEAAGNGLDDDGNGYVDDIHGWNFYDNNNDATDLNGHGTHTAGTMGAVGNNALGVTGVNWHCKIMPLKFIGPNGGYTSDAIRALEYAVSMGVKVSNNSWGNTTFEQSLTDAIAAAQTSGHLFVAAAGNTGANTDVSPQYPASYSNANIISVAAVDSTGALPWFTSYGPTSVDIAAPGVGIWSTVPGNNVASMDGTSMASPHVAGAAALLWGMNPTWTWSAVKSRILAKAVPCASLKGMCVSGGRLDLYATLTDAPLPPILRITSPGTAAMLSQPEVLLTAKATDGLDGVISRQILWSDSAAGQIAQGPACFVGNLSTGQHIITATVTNSRGMASSTTIAVQVCPPGPMVSGLPQTSNVSYPEGASISFTASANDPTYGSLTPQILWNSSLQGSLGQGGSITTASLAPGVHVITAQASNSAGVTAGQPTMLTITPATSVPIAPSGLGWSKYVSGTLTYIKVAWADTSNNETSFDVEVSTKTSTKSWSAGVIQYHALGDQTYVLTNPGAGYTYRFRVRAVNSMGPSAWSAYSASLKV